MQMESPSDLRLLSETTTQNEIRPRVSQTREATGSERDHLYEVRVNWSFEVATSLQRAACKLICADRDEFCDVIRSTIADLPDPLCPADRGDLSRRLLEFSLRVGRTFHDRHHRDTAARCAFVPETTCAIWFAQAADPKALLAEWLACYLAIFDRAHPAPAAQRAAKILRDQSTHPLKVGALARAVGVSRSVLLRQFAREYGMSPAEYRTRARLIVGIAALQEPTVKVSEAARQAGYRSTTSFYIALRKYLKLTPSEVRGVPQDPTRGRLSADLIVKNANKPKRCA